MTPRQLVLGAVVAALLSVAGCGSLYLGDNPRPDVRKGTGPLTVPPSSVRDGTTR